MKKLKMFTAIALTLSALTGCQTTFSATNNAGADNNMVKTQ